jgi:hypothetical protein
MPAYHVVRNDREFLVPESRLTPQEREELAERASSPEARRAFGAKLRSLRRAEDAPLKAALKAAADPKLSADDRRAILADAAAPLRQGLDRHRREQAERNAR